MRYLMISYPNPEAANRPPVGVKGLKAECLDWVEKHWTDMRPKSLREKMVQQGL
jgi:hypothetical protein